MKKILATLAACLIVLGMHAQISQEAYKTWHQNKYSMFIHFGLYYCQLGGMEKGKPVTRGYSEQIQSFAEGFRLVWRYCLAFNPTAFNADSIVALAEKEAGMKSIVITTKHHDGFCMFHTATTDFNSYDATPAKRDFVKELADACQRGGVRLGLYYSIIDWHYPYGHPISSHNCDFVTPEHHDFSKQQVTELLTNYGSISELWFDMGSNTPNKAGNFTSSFTSPCNPTVWSAVESVTTSMTLLSWLTMPIRKVPYNAPGKVPHPCLMKRGVTVRGKNAEGVCMKKPWKNYAA